MERVNELKKTWFNNGCVTGTDRDLLEWLVTRHHDYEGGRFETENELVFKIERNSSGMGTTTEVKAYDNKTNVQITPFSIRACVIGPKKGTPKHVLDVKRAARYEIRDQITAFRRTHKHIGVCMFKDCCNPVSFCDNKTHVDHILDHDVLLKNWLNTQKLLISSIEIDDSAFEPHIIRFANIQQRVLWRTYHQENARLRLLCWQCNLSRRKD